MPRSAQCRSSRTSSEPRSRRARRAPRRRRRTAGGARRRRRPRRAAARRRRRPGAAPRRTARTGASGSSEQRPSRTGAPPRERLARELVREPGLADAGLAGDQHEPPGRGASARRPRTRAAARARRARPTNGVSWSRAQGRRRRHGGHGAGVRRSSSSSARVSRDGAIAERRRAGARRSARPRRAPRRGRRHAASRSMRRRLASSRERVERDLLAREPDRLGGIGGGARRAARAPRASRSACASRAACAQSSSKPSRMGARHAASAARGIAGAERPLELARVDGEPVAVQRDGVARGDDVAGGRPERAPQLGQRGAQARARRLVEHVRPEARRERPARRAGPDAAPGRRAGSARAARRGGASSSPPASSRRPPPSRTRNTRPLCGSRGARASRAVATGPRACRSRDVHARRTVAERAAATIAEP